MHFSKIPEYLIELQQEIANGKHPRLTAELAKFTHEAMEVRLGVIAAHCGIPVDGYFTEAGIKALCKRLMTALENRRENPHGIIIVDDPSKYIH